jgi:hypothetical protein
MSHCLATTQMAGRLGLPAEVCEPLGQVFTRWDAKGSPKASGVSRSHIRCGCSISLTPSRCSTGRAAWTPLSRWHGPGGASTSTQEWWTCSARRPLRCWPDMEAMAECTALIEAEPGLRRQLTERELDSALEAVADFTDLRSPVPSRALPRGSRPGRLGRRATRAAGPGGCGLAARRSASRCRHARGCLLRSWTNPGH